jgi:hypothetical protein
LIKFFLRDSGLIFSRPADTTESDSAKRLAA